MTQSSEKQNSAPLKWILELTRPDLFSVIALTLTETLQGLCSVGMAWLLRGLIDAAVSKSPDGFKRYALLLVLMIVVQLALSAVLRRLTEATKANIENRLKSRLFGTLLRKDYAAVTATHSGEWMNRLTSDTVVVADGVTGILPGAAGMLVRIIGAAALLVWLLPNIAWIILPGGVILALLTYAFRRHLKQLHKRIQEADGRLRIFLSERLSNLLIVRSFARESQAAAEADGLMRDHKRARMKRNTFSNAANIGFGLVMRGAYVLVAVVCGYGILKGTVSYGSFTAVLHLVNQVQSPFANITGYFPKYYAMLASAERLAEAESYSDGEAEEPVPQSEIKAFYDESFRAVKFDGVTFSYGGGDPAVSNVSLSIDKGDLICVTGPSGSGKSTLLKLLLSLYAPDSGSITLVQSGAEQPLSAAYCGLFAYVPQGNQLMSGSIREAVSFGDEAVMKNDAAIRSALRVACAEDFVYSLPAGLETPLGERGSGLSEGQVQRLAIARAILSGRPVLLLDEATSALDEATEARVLENLRSLTDRTAVLVTHRPGAMAACSKRVELSRKDPR